MKARSLGLIIALVVFALDQLAKWSVTGPLGVDHVGAQLYLLSIFLVVASPITELLVPNDEAA